MSYASAAKGDPIGSEEKKPDPVEVSDAAPEEAAVACPKKEAKKKVFAPAPVPEKLAWGAVSAAAANDIDDQKWPTPQEAPVDKGQSQKFIKPSTSKWVPIPARVVLPATRATQGQKQNRNRKKTPKPKKRDDDPALAGEDADSESSQTTTPPGDDAQFKFNPNLKPFRKFLPNGHYPLPTPANLNHHTKRYQNGGYYHPQPYYGKQYRAGAANGRGGAKGASPRYYPNGPYRGYGYGMVPQQPTIPPALSPKQNPQEALTQQLDYYFSLENLIRDIYLRKNMDADGWVALPLLLNFKRVQTIFEPLEEEYKDDTTKAVVGAISQCVNVEVRYGDATADTASLTDVLLRVKENHEQWLMPESS